jgi:hypothetical protein
MTAMIAVKTQLEGASQYGSSHPNVGIIFRRVPIPMLNKVSAKDTQG